MASAGDRVLVDLNNTQMRYLAIAVHAQELENLQKIKFKSQEEQLKYLNSCTEGKKKVEELLMQLDKMAAEIDQHSDETKKSIAHDIFEYANKGLGLSLQLIRSYSARKKHLEKLGKHCGSLIKRLRSLDPATEEKEARDLALEALNYRRAILDHAKKMQQFIPNQFTKWLKERNLTFEELVEEFKEKLNLTKPFKELSDTEKLKVYESIMEKAGKGKSVVNFSFEAMGSIGATVLVFTAGAMVWDIFTAEDKLRAAVSDISNVLLSQFDIAALASAAIENGLEMAGVEVAGAAITVVGTVIGFGIGVLIGAAVDALLDLIFGTGSTKVMITHGLTHCYVSPMPDGVQLARIIKAEHP